MAKSAAQIRRAQKRAESRGEVYVPPHPSTVEKIVHESSSFNDIELEKESNSSGTVYKKSPKSKLIDHKEKIKVAAQLKKELESIERSTELKSKDRRAAKRKAEAIATGAAGCSSVELLEWYEQQQSTKQDVKAKNPYIAFVGQLSYDTSVDDLFAHIETELQNDKDFETTITKESVKIRLRSDPKTKKSLGMAFVEVGDPETLYALLKLHHTFLKGRRINVERSGGGGKTSRTSKITTFREEQSQYMLEVVRNMIKEYQDRGEIKVEGELDEGVISLCTRHSATVVQAALERYTETNGRDMDNPSAYLSFLLGKLASEGIYKSSEDGKRSNTEKSKRIKSNN